MIEYKNIHKKVNFLAYFEKYKEIRIGKGIADENIQNIDETRFYVGCNRVYQIITFNLSKLLFLTDSNNRKYITSVESIGTGGKTIPPMLILYKVHILNNGQKKMILIMIFTLLLIL